MFSMLFCGIFSKSTFDNVYVKMYWHLFVWMRVVLTYYTIRLMCSRYWKKETEYFRQPKEKPVQKEKAPAKEEKEDDKKGKKEKKRAVGKKLPAVPESVLKSRKRRDLAKAARLNVALKVIWIKS